MKAADQFRQSDVVLWGLVALIFGAVAVLSANISAIVPDSVLAGLHASRLEGADLSQLREQIANLRVEAMRLRQANTELESRFSLAEQSDKTVVRRVAALEVSLPRLVESLAADRSVDRSIVTSSIGAAGEVTFDAVGGSVKVRHEPFDPSMAVPADAGQPMPSVPPAPASARGIDPGAHGAAIGAPLPADGGDNAWADLANKVGPLLLGLEPLIGDGPESRNRLVVGPIRTSAEASQFCARIEKVGMSCKPVPFTGTALPPRSPASAGR